MPKSLFQQAQIRLVLQDMRKRYRYITEAKDEIKTLDRAAIYTKLYKQMVFDLRRAYLFWKGDQLAFIKAVAAFYSDYGAILNLLKQDYDRGKFKPT
jgi:D-mannonate dehydratase